MKKTIITMALILGPLSLLPFALIARARVSTSEKPRIHIIHDMDNQERYKAQMPNPVFRDGRAYSYARILREAYGYEGELRAVGEVLLEQLHFMIRVGFDAFELQGDDPERAWQIAAEEFSAWYQPGADERPTAMQLRRQKG